MKSRARIIATVGPSSSSASVLQKMLQAGVNVFRLNMSHGTHETHREMMKKIRKLKSGCYPAVMMDLQGPKIRVALLEEPLTLKRGKTVTLTASEKKFADSFIPTTYKNLARDVRKGSRILLDDGKMELKVVRTAGMDVECTVKHGGLLKQRKGINLPDADVSAPAMTPKDKKDLLFGIREGVDYIALSFVRKPEDIKKIKSLLRAHGSDIPVIAKIEKPEAAARIDKIIEQADGVMVARGDLGVEMSAQKVPVLQKQIIQKANRAGKLVITATQMLESMMDTPVPTRAEASDIANAIMDGTDAVMLSGETAAGKYPVKCVQVMRSIVKEAGESLYLYNSGGDLHIRDGYLPYTIAESAFHACDEIKDSVLVVFTLSGATALYISKLRPAKKIIALTPDEKVCRRLALAWGVRPLLTPFGKNTDEMIRKGEKRLLESRLVRAGQKIVIVAGSTPSCGGTNMLIIHELRR